MVAPSYQSYEVVSEVYSANGKEYIDIKHPNTGNIRKARWYSDAEYVKAFGKILPNSSEKIGKPLFSQYKALGFADGGYVTIFKGATAADEEYFSKNPARYCNYWGWYLPSGEELADLPANILPIRMGWSIVSDNEDTLYPEETVKKNVKALLKEVVA